MITFTGLTEEQRRIVEWGDGPAVVIAGAGTGKTRVIVERVRHLLETRDGLQPENLLVLTYNVKAAAELRERIEAAVGIADAARHDGQQLPQLLPGDPDRQRGRRRAAGSPRCPRRRRPGAAPARPRARARAALSRDQRLHVREHRQLHQSMQGRARPTLRFRSIRARRAPRVRAALRRRGGRRPAARDAGQPATASERARCLRRRAHRGTGRDGRRGR